MSSVSFLKKCLFCEKILPLTEQVQLLLRSDDLLKTFTSTNWTFSTNLTFTNTPALSVDYHEKLYIPSSRFVRDIPAWISITPLMCNNSYQILTSPHIELSIVRQVLLYKSINKSLRTIPRLFVYSRSWEPIHLPYSNIFSNFQLSSSEKKCLRMVKMFEQLEGN